MWIIKRRTKKQIGELRNEKKRKAKDGGGGWKMKWQENKTEQEEMTKIKSETVMLTFMKQATKCTRLHTSHFQAQGKNQDF